MDLNAATELALNLMKKHGVYETFDFKFSNSKKSFGVTSFRYPSKSFIALSAPLTMLNDEEEVKDTILHEIAHALCPIDEGHGKLWHETAKQIGARPERMFNSSSVKMPETKYIYVCSHCGHTINAGRKYKYEYACKSCCIKYNKGKYSILYKYIFKLNPNYEQACNQYKQALKKANFCDKYHF